MQGNKIFHRVAGLHTVKHSALDLDGFANVVLAQIDPNISLSISLQEKNTILRNRLKGQTYLVVIDNLETVVGYQTLISQICRLANPSKFLLTSRLSLHDHPDVFCQTISELNPR